MQEIVEKMVLEFNMFQKLIDCIISSVCLWFYGSISLIKFYYYSNGYISKEITEVLSLLITFVIVIVFRYVILALNQNY